MKTTTVSLLACLLTIATATDAPSAENNRGILNGPLTKGGHKAKGEGDRESLRLAIEDLMATLPQAFAGQNSTWANGASGTATVDLRNIGSERTLVLINGRRMAPGSPRWGYAPDLNTIPASMLKRVDVLTGGASAVYGNDAVAGVVNFILDTEFEGMRADVQYSFFNHDNNNALTQSMNDARGFTYPTGGVTDGDACEIGLRRPHAAGHLVQREVLGCHVGFSSVWLGRGSRDVA